MNSNRSYIVNAIIEWILDNNCTPHLILDTSIPGVEVPTEGIRQNRIVLNVSPQAVSQFNLNVDGLSFDARFGGVSRRIHAPVGAILGVYAKENGEGMAFPVASDAEEPQHGQSEFDLKRGLKNPKMDQTEGSEPDPSSSDNVVPFKKD